MGFLAGILTFTPYYHWRWEHAIHHSNAGDLDKRGTGDVWTMTVQEYLESLPLERSSPIGWHATLWCSLSSRRCFCLWSGSG